jgi:putative DNA primase/helicase
MWPGDDGTASLPALSLPPTRAVKTPRKGYHLIFRYPEAGEIGRLIGVLPGIDLLGDNGYIIASGSCVDGKYYEVLRDREPAPCPPILLELAQKKRKKHDAAAAAIGPGGKIGEGKRNDYLASVAGVLRRSGLDADAIEATLHVENVKKCDPPLEAAEAATIARSIARYEPEQPLEPGAVIEKEERQQKLEWLAKLSRLEYDRQRVDAAKELGVRTPTLDAEVAGLRAEIEPDEPGLAFSDPEPWPEVVDGAALLGSIRCEIERYVILPPHASTAVSLWSLHTWCLDALYISPYLYLRSPEKRCGKTTLMLVLRGLVRRPLIATSASPAAIFRCIEQYGPTLLLDEADTWMREADEFRGILNGGHSRSTAQVLRTIGDDHEVHAFSTFCGKAFSGIGRLIDTLEDRSIIVAMQRKRPEDRAERLREEQFESDIDPLRQQCRRWAKDNLKALRHTDPATPAALNDRAADNWRALLAIADLAGGNWPKDAHAAALALSADSDDEAVGAQLLADIRTIFDRMDDPERPIASATLIESLGAMEDRPWSDWKQGKAITAPQIARLLKAFSIRPRVVRIGTGTPRGYYRSQFEDAFARYLRETAEIAPQTATPPQQHQFGSQTAIPSRNGPSATAATPQHDGSDSGDVAGVAATRSDGVAVQDAAKAYENRDCGGVAVQEAEKSAGEGSLYSEVF